MSPVNALQGVQQIVAPALARRHVEYAHAGPGDVYEADMNIGRSTKIRMARCG